MPVRVFITQGTTADCTQADRLIEGLDADYLLADRGYDSNAIIEQARKQGMEAIIPPKKNRTAQRSYDKELYKLRHLVENAFLHIKRWRGIATRYAKNRFFPCRCTNQMYRSLGKYLVTTLSKCDRSQG